MSTELKDLKPGDEVIYDPPGFSRSREVEAIDRVTPTQIIIGTRRFNRSTGRAIGYGSNSFASARIRAAAPGQVDGIRAGERHFALAIQVSKAHWLSLTTDQLEQVAAIVFPTTKTPQ